MAAGPAPDLDAMGGLVQNGAMVSDALLARAMLDPVPLPEGADAGAVVRAALDHGIAGCLAASGTLARWPDPARTPLMAQARGQTLWELRHRAVISALLAALDEAGVGCVIHKGTALAYGVYDPPSARARGDTDLLIAPQDLAPARAVLRRAGFTSPLDDDAPATARRQEPWSRTVPDGTVHEIDLHWRLSNNPALAAVLPEAEVAAQAVPLPALGPSARVPGLPHALIHGVLHRAGHRVAPYYVEGTAVAGADRLIWLFDIDRMARAMTPDQAATVEALALDRGVGPLLAEALSEAAEAFGTPLAAGLADRLAAGPRGPAMRFVERTDRAGRLWADLLAERGAAARLRFLRGKLFPPAATVRGRLRDHAGRPLPVLYLIRLARFLQGRR